MDSKAILEDLRKIFVNEIWLTPEMLAPYIRRSPKAQANLRSNGGFMLPVRLNGAKPVVSIYDLADWLSKPPQEPPVEVSEPTPATTDKKSSKKINRPSLATSISQFKTQGVYILELAANLEKIELEEVLNGRDLPSLKRIRP